jgi:hypothetical protein
MRRTAMETRWRFDQEFKEGAVQGPGEVVVDGVPLRDAPITV